MVTIDKIRFSDEYTGALSGAGSDPGVDFLMGAVGDKIWFQIDFHVEWLTSKKAMLFNAADNTITRQDITGSFIQDEFSPGDTIAIVGAGANDGNYTIDTVTSNVITTTGALAADGLFGSVSIYGTTDIDYFDFYYNNIANSFQETFTALTEPNTQKLSTITTDVPGTWSLKPSNKTYSWNDMLSATLTEVSTYGYPTYNQYFKIVGWFFIKPFYLNGQKQNLVDLLNGVKVVPPEYFRDTDCLKFVYKIDCRYAERDLTVYHSSDPNTFKLGNTGWFNEKLDSVALTEPGTVQWNLVSINYTDNATGYPTDSLDYVDKTDVEIVIQPPIYIDPTSAPFVVNFMWLPTSQEAYQFKGLGSYTDDEGQNNDFRHLFLHDRAFQNEGAVAVNGDRFGTAYQVLKNITGTVSGGNLVINFTTDFGSYVRNVFSGAVYGRDYMIWVTPQDPDVTTLVGTDRVAVLCDVNTAATDTDDPDIFSIVTDTTSGISFFQAPDSNVVPYTNVAGFVGEYWKAFCQFIVHNNCTINKINVGVRVDVLNSSYNPEGSFFLETWNNVTNDFYNGEFTDIDIEQSRGFYLENESPFDIRSIVRNTSLDSGVYLGYDINYGFQLGYQWWQTLTDYAKQYETYRNQYWAVYTQNKVVGGNPIQVDGGLATIKMVITWEIKNNSSGITTTFNHTAPINVYDQNPGYTAVITTADAVFGDDLSQQVANDVQTQITAVFSGTNITVPGSGEDLFAEFVIYYQDGSVNRYDRVTTVDAPLSESKWINQPIITVDNANQATVTATVDVRKEMIIKILVRFGPTIAGLTTDGGDQIETDGGGNIIVD